MAFGGKIHIETICDKKVVYYLPYHLAEVNTCKYLINLDQVDFNIKEKDVLPILEQVERESSIELTEKQREATIESIINGVTVITGGPGTGKTTIIKSIINLFEK